MSLGVHGVWFGRVFSRILGVSVGFGGLVVRGAQAGLGNSLFVHAAWLCVQLALLFVKVSDL